MSELTNRDILRASNEESNRITKECIQTALLYLMGVKPYDKITITELVLRSGVSRMSFYRNYKTKDDVVKEICADVRKTLAETANDKDFEENPRQWYINFFSDIKDNEKLITLVEKSSLPLSSILKSLYDAKDYSKSYEDKGKYALSAREGALLGVALTWTSSGMKETPEEMADICVDILKSY